MDAHLKSVGKEMAYVWLNFIIRMMKIGCCLSLILFLLSMVAMPMSIASIITVPLLAWCVFWIYLSKYCIKKFDLENHYQ